MTKNYGSSWGGSDRESRYGGTSYGSSWGGSSGDNSPKKDHESQKPQTSVLPVVALVAAILGLLFAVIPIVGIILTNIALLLSVVAGYRAFKKGAGNKGVAAAAIVVTFIGDTLAVIHASDEAAAQRAAEALRACYTVTAEPPAPTPFIKGVVR